MNIKQKITIPEPCHENWDKMTPKENGRFCMSCSKTVIDFTSMLPDEIQHFFIQNQNNKICGRFRKSQLDTINIQIPNQVFYSQTSHRKMFLLALFAAMGTTLFSCADKNGNKKKIDKVEVVTDNVPTEHILLGEPTIDETDTNQSIVPPPPPAKVDQVKFVKGEPEIKAKTVDYNKKKQETIVEDVVYNGGVAIETNAEFPGGIDQFYNFFGKEFKKPDDIATTNPKVTISFAVEKNGSMSFLQCDPANDKILETEIIRVLSVCPKWQPATSNGRKIRRQYSLPMVLQ